MRVNGGSASVSNKDPPPDKRAAMPQGPFKAHPVHLRAGEHAPPPSVGKKFDAKNDKGKAAGAAGMRGFKRSDGGGEGDASHLKTRDMPGGFDYGNVPVRGVNLGGWLVCE